MIIFLYGPDSYRRLQKKKELISSSENKSGLRAEVFDLADANQTAGFFNFLKSRSLFEESKLGAVENFSELKLDKETKKILADLAEAKTPVTIISEDSAPASKSSFLLKPPVKSQSFPLLTKSEIPAFIKKEALQRNLALSSSDVSSLAESFGADGWGIASELDKLALGGRRTKFVSTGNYFELINILKYGREVDKKLAVLEFILSVRRDDPARVFNSLAYGVSRDKFFLNRLTALDVAVKSGKLEYEEALVAALFR